MSCESCDMKSEKIESQIKERDELLRLNGEVPKRLLEAVLAEQDRCAKIAEAFWDGADKLNADLRADLTQVEKSMAYMISTNIRALRRRESDFAVKRKCECVPCSPCNQPAGESGYCALCASNVSHI